MDFVPLYYGNKENALPLFNPQGNAGVVTLWHHPEKYASRLRDHFPQVFGEESPLVTLTSLYGNGLPQMLANLAYNPQISRLAVTGNDTKVVPSFSYLDGFLKGEVDFKEVGGAQMVQVRGTNYMMDGQLRPDMFSHLEVQRFETGDLEGLVNYVMESSKRPVREEDRIRIDLVEPEFSDFPSDIYSHNVDAKTPLAAWQEVLFLLDRFGVNVPLEKGERRALYNLDVSIHDASFEREGVLKRWGFDPDSLRSYQEEMLRETLPEGVRYTYGNRLRGHFGGDPLECIVKQLREDPKDRHSLISLWDTGSDLIQREASPCFSDVYFAQDPLDSTLSLTAGFRTHNAASAWLTNVYGLRGIQEFVANQTDMKPGRLNVRSRWISIDPTDPKIQSTLAKIKKERKVGLDVEDPRGYFTVEVEGSEIVATHHNPDGLRLGEYRGSDMMEVKDAMRGDHCFSTNDHAMWIAMELARAQFKLKGNVDE